MRVKIFQEAGHLAIKSLEKTMNDWFHEQERMKPHVFRLIDIKIAQSGGGVPDDEIFQALTVIVMYEFDIED